jgi:hypothetical protein
MMFTEHDSIRGIVRESRKPLTGGLGLERAREKVVISKDEYA